MSEKYLVEHLDQNGEPLDESMMLLETISVHGPQKGRGNSYLSTA